MTSPGCSIHLNGEPYELSGGGTVLSLLDQLGHDPRTVAIELNGEVLARGRFGDVELAAGDRVEVVRFVQGGRPLRLRRLLARP